MFVLVFVLIGFRNLDYRYEVLKQGSEWVRCQFNFSATVKSV